MLRGPVRATRRAALVGGGVAALGLGGCSTSGRDPTAPVDSSGPATIGSQQPTSPSVDADRRVVDDVVQDLSSTHALVRRVRREHPDLSSRLEPFEVLHRDHAERLDTLGSSKKAPSDQTDDAALRRVDAAEKDLQKSLTRASVHVASGSLAATLASMAAAVAQLRAEKTGSS